MTDKLRECPFCGCPHIYEITRNDGIVDKIPQLFCNRCKMTFEVENDSPFMSDTETFEYLKEKLHTTWNTRKPMDRIVEEVNEIGRRVCNNVKCNHECVEDSERICDHGVLMGAVIDAIVKGVQNACENKSE